jgi:hypothetical protein
MTQELNFVEAISIAREAVIYGFPIVEGYKTLYKQAVDDSGSDYKAPFNHIGHARDVATPEDTWVVTPNSDTPYSFSWLDLRAEPVVITMPTVEGARYYSAQLIDLSTFNFAYLGTRSFGNGGGDFLITGPDWKGEPPGGIKAVIPCETQLLYALFRTQLFNADDIASVRTIQDGYRVQPLSAYLGSPAPAAAPAIDWPKPVADMTESPSVFSYLNFLIQFIPSHPSETEVLARFARLGIGTGRPFEPDTLSPDLQAAVAEGIKQAFDEDLAGMVKRINTGTLSSGDLFGTRAFLQNNYLYRFTGAKLGIFGNSRDEAFYPAYFADAEGKQPDASQHRYVLRFAKGQLPPAEAFWSLTMYDGKTQLLVANHLRRYLLNSPMEEIFKVGTDGSVTFYIQKDSPGTDQESNWLPAPDGPFYLIMRIYIPKPDTFNGQWQQPKLECVS